MFELPQKLVDFLAAAYGMPAEIRAKLIDKYDSVEDRNTAMVLMCFECFITHAKTTPAVETLRAAGLGKATGAFNDLPKEEQTVLFDRFLAEAVVLTYS